MGSKMDWISKLQNIGLTKREATVYLFLFEAIEAKASTIFSKTGVPSSHIYKVLENLISKGLVSYKIVNNVKIFRPADPETLYSIFNEKEKEIEREKKELREFISSLKKLEIKERKENDYKYFEGLIGIKSMFTEFINSWKEGSSMFIASAPIAYEKWNAFLLDYFHPPRIQKKIKLNLLTPIKLKERGKERSKLQYTEVRYYDHEFESEFGVCGQYTYILSFGEKPYAFLIKDENYAKTQKKVFNIFWNLSK